MTLPYFLLPLWCFAAGVDAFFNEAVVRRQPSASAFGPKTFRLRRRRYSAPRPVVTAIDGEGVIGPLQSTVAGRESVRIREQGAPDPRRELFSVAPMMGHTNRHYMTYFRSLSERAHLYTEMIPAGQIVRAYRRARAELGIGSRSSQDEGGALVDEECDPREVVEVVSLLLEVEGTRARRGGDDCAGRDPGSGSAYDPSNTLTELLRMPCLLGSDGVAGAGPVVLQLGGRDPRTLSLAAAVGAAIGYDEINLNCGCPSDAVAVSGEGSGCGQGSGVALMREPELVSRGVDEEMRTVGGNNLAKATCKVTVKHRLGVADASFYDAKADRLQGDDESFSSCRDFVRAITASGVVSKVIVHARLGILGWGQGLDDSSGSTRLAKHGAGPKSKARVKAKKASRLRTKLNRSVPPLRPQAVEAVAAEFPGLEVVTNGGMNSLEDVRDRVWEDSGCSISGGMVGRAVINHPCAFATADDLWDDREDRDLAISSSQLIPTNIPTRGQVLREYSTYCSSEERRVVSLGASAGQLDLLRRSLVAAPFHLFTGEEGSDAYQRRIRKLASRKLGKGGGGGAAAILEAASMELSPAALDKCVNVHVPWKDVKTHEFAARSGRMQRIIK